jgi:hypothetical protein
MDHDGWTWRFIVNGGQIFSAGHKAAVLRVSLETYERALAILNVVALALVRRGFEVAHSERNGRMVIDGYGGAINLRITERLEERVRKVPSYDGTLRSESYKVPTGVLRLHLETRRSTGFSLEDAKGQPIEAQLREMFLGLYRMVIRCRIAQRVSDERSRQWAEEQQRREAAELVRREEERRIAEERRKREALLADADLWSRARRLRDYVAHIEKVAAIDASAGSCSQTMQAWTAWASAVADDLDPSIRVSLELKS